MQTVKNFIPNLLTLMNLLCGIIGIYLTFHGAMQWAAVLIFVGGFFDFFDGLVARLLGAHSELGKQLDSLADMVTFGVLPGLIMFNLILASQGNYFADFNSIPLQEFMVASLGLLIPLFAALRLAKFNISENQSDEFIGIPTPAVAIFVAGLPIAIEWQYYLNMYTPHSVQEFVALSKIYYWNNTDIGLMLFITNTWFYAIAALGLSALMVLPLPIISFKFKNLKFSDNKWRYGFIITALLSIIFAFLHDIVYIQSIPYIQWLIIPILIAELIVCSMLKNIFSSTE